MALTGPGSILSLGPSVETPKGPKIEEQRAESAGGVLGRGSELPPHQLWGLSERFPSGAWGEYPAAKSSDASCSQTTSPAMENRVCIVQVYHFTHFVTHATAIIALQSGLLFSCLLFSVARSGGPVH